MTTDEYVPSEAEMMIAWHRHATAEDAKHGRLRDDSESTTKEFVRYMARARRDAAREALDGLIAWHRENAQDAETPAPVRRGIAVMADEAQRYRDTHYPEETP